MRVHAGQYERLRLAECDAFDSYQSFQETFRLHFGVNNIIFLYGLYFEHFLHDISV
jgi:hypothetical protein